MHVSDYGGVVRTGIRYGNLEGDGGLKHGGWGMVDGGPGTGGDRRGQAYLLECKSLPS